MALDKTAWFLDDILPVGDATKEMWVFSALWQLPPLSSVTYGDGMFDERV